MFGTIGLHTGLLERNYSVSAKFKGYRSLVFEFRDPVLKIAGNRPMGSVSDILVSHKFLGPSEYTQGCWKEITQIRQNSKAIGHCFSIF